MTGCGISVPGRSRVIDLLPRHVDHRKVRVHEEIATGDIGGLHRDATLLTGAYA